ncbi:17777_t:CDS:2 [Cetraspora pellucida]|uniref:17777_t:CDS:1 n=1 Tax=Cetraspora pellucida TaxID=1433469 RepID=A0ACA9M7H5_9GLOM|nr:17777_t:CDS:2 [Cetraspora pellucida]
MSPHNFRNYFTLIKNPNNPTNALAMCNWCIRKYGGLGITQLKPECCTVNRARLCCNHLSKCEAFREESETNESVNLHADSVISTVSSNSSVNSRHSAITNFLCRPLMVNEQSQFEQLLLRMIVSNALPFTFVENEDTIAVFEFLVPELKLPKRKVIGGRFLSSKFNDHRSNVTQMDGILFEPADNRTTLRNNTRKLPDDIADIINDTQFWIMLANLQELLYPLCGFLNQLQKDTARLYEVLRCFGYIMKIFECQEDFEFGTRMKARIELRWNEWEQPLIILSFTLHLAYKLTKFNSIVANLLWTHIGQWLKYYYEAWFNCKPVSILAELIKYKREIDPYYSESFKQFKGNLVDFWESTEGVGPELARAAIRVHRICINSASVECLWSSMGLLHSNRKAWL